MAGKFRLRLNSKIGRFREKTGIFATHNARASRVVSRQKSTESVEFSRSNFILSLIHAVEECIYNDTSFFKCVLTIRATERRRKNTNLTHPSKIEFSLLRIEKVRSHPDNSVHNSNL